MKRRIKDLPEQDRPREKLLAKGPGALSDQELLAVLLGKGTRDMDVMTLAAKVARPWTEKGLDVAGRRPDAIRRDRPRQGRDHSVGVEFARRRIKPEGMKISTPADVLPLIRHFADRKQEHFLSITVNGANEVLNVRVVSIGLVDRSPVHPREVFADVLADRASGIIVAHNHPAGSLEPSSADVDSTYQLKQAGEILGVQFLDHIIFNRSAYYSFLESGRL